jgi:tripartite-type tricarboxylate transporter receptor subunit TctC
VYDAARNEALQKEAEGLPSLLLNSAAAANAVMLGAGYFNPLTGYMNRADALSVAERLHTTGGLFWPVPVVNLTHDASAIRGAKRIALRDLRGAAPDGGTIMIATNSPFTVYPHIYVKLDYDPVKDFTPIAAVATFDQGIATGPMTGAQNVKELISWINANKSRAVYGTPGAGTLPHFLGIAFSRATGLQMNPVHYKGGSPPMADLAGGHLPVLCNGLSDMLEMHRAGKVRVLAVASAQRSPVLPDVPTLKEVGVDLTMSVTAGIFGPPGMSASVLSRMEAAIAQARTRDSVRERMARIGLTASTLNSAQFTAALAEESARLQVLVKASGYQPE